MKIQCVNIQGNKHEFDESEFIERNSVYGVHVKDKQILLVQDYWAKRWELPGGGIEEGETIKDALLREFEEETGLKIDEDIQELLKVQSYFLAPRKEKPWKTKRTVYQVKVIGGVLQENINKLDVLQAKYFPIDAVRKLIMNNNVDNLLTPVLKKLNL